MTVGRSPIEIAIGERKEGSQFMRAIAEGRGIGATAHADRRLTRLVHFNVGRGFIGSLVRAIAKWGFAGFPATANVVITGFELNNFWFGHDFYVSWLVEVKSSEVE